MRASTLGYSRNGRRISLRLKALRNVRHRVREPALHRRHLRSHARDRIYREILERRGVKRGSGARNDKTSATVAEVANDLGVPKRTLEHNIATADAYDALPEPVTHFVRDSRTVTDRSS